MLPTSTPEPVHQVVRGDTGSDSSTAAELVAGLASDAKHLGEAYVELVRFEVERQLRKAAYFLVGGALLFIAALLGSVALSFILTENVDISRGAALAIVSAIVCAMGAAWVVLGVHRARTEGGAR